MDEVENEKWCDFTDWVGDRWTDFEAWAGFLDVKKYVDDINGYHKKVIDKNNTTAEKINQIFEDVNSVTESFKTRFSAHLTDLTEYIKSINALAETVAPQNGNFNSEYIAGTLTDTLTSYIETSSVMQQIAGDGLSQESASQISESSMNSILSRFASVYLANSPSLALNQKLEIPIGPGMTFYYGVEGKANGEGPVDINAVIKDQKLSLENIGISGPLSENTSFSVNSSGEVDVKNSDTGSGIKLSGDGIETSKEVTVGNNVYNYKYAYNPLTNEFTVEHSVATEIEAGSVTSKVGIKFSDQQDNNGWQPMPAPVAVESPYTSQIPDFDFNWQPVEVDPNTVIIVGGVLIAVAAIALAPATGGGSLAFAFI